jgi:endonuclease VIII
MPEGDTLYRTAATLRKALLGKTVVRFKTSVDTVAAVDEDHPVAGRTVSAVESRGKHLLITFQHSGVQTFRCSGVHEETSRGQPDLHVSAAPTPQHLNTPTPASPTPERLNARTPERVVLHTHLRMTGSWHIYRPGEPWQKPSRYAKVVIHTEDFVVPCFSAPVVELLTARQAERHPALVQLGPDAITPEFDPAEVLRRMRRLPEVEIGVAIMNQRVLAGVGNIYKSEVLFIRRLSPFLKVGELSDETLAGVIQEAHRLLLVNREGGARRTMFGLDSRRHLWIYGRSGEPCRVCGETIRMRRQGIDARSTYYCPQCQA